MNALSLSAPALLLAVIACDSKQPQNRYVEPPPSPVTVAKPTQQNLQLSREWTGRIVADTVEIRARVTGFLQAVHFKDGQDVKAGDLLFEIDPAPYQAALDRAKAEVAAADARVALAEAEMARWSELFAVDAATQAEFDTKKAQLAVAQAAKQQAEAAVRTAEIDLGYTKIHAPIDARIGESIYTVGALVGSLQSTLLATLVQLQPIYCYFNASEAEFLEYQRDKREGRTQAAADGKTRAVLGLGDDVGHPHEGVLDFADPQLDESTGTIQLRAMFKNADLALVPGLFARIQVPGPERAAILVPEAVVQIDQAGRFVLVVNEQQVVERRDITPGAVLGDRRVVASGLQGDESVIVNGLARARPGAKVAPTEKK